MPTQEELEALLVKLTEAGREGKATLAELHGERKALLELRKAIRTDIVRAVETEVAARLAEITEDTKSQMTDLAVAMVDEVATKLKERLGL